ncbi:MAG: hypothetical protein JWP33_693 [Blastococcus sp.]|jgi:hypothetical protein|nr:hypothetical protein [Blastococcus sp.]
MSVTVGASPYIGRNPYAVPMPWAAAVPEGPRSEPAGDGQQQSVHAEQDGVA